MVSPLPPSDLALHDLVCSLVEKGYRFVTGTPATHARVNARAGHEEAHDLLGVFGWSRPFRPGVLSEDMLDLLRRGGALREEGGLCRSLVRVSTLHGMTFLHSAYPTTAADSVFFGPDTYRFADAIAAALRERQAPVRRAADIGCGAGPGGLVVAQAYPGAEVCMLDINPAALRLARINAALAGCTGAEAANSNLLRDVDGAFDLVVANPPYMVDPAERAYRHGGGPLGAGLSLDILDATLPRLSPGGTLLLYTGAAVVNGIDDFRDAAAGRLHDDDLVWSYREIDPDVFGEELETAAYRHTDRIAAVVLTVTKIG